MNPWMEVRVLLPQPNGAWDCLAWSSPWQGEIQAGLSAIAPLRGATADAIDSLRHAKLGLTPAPADAPLRTLPRSARRLHHFLGSQALTVMPPVLTRQNPEHYRGGPPWLGGAAVSAAPS